ncbi:hypothetical protein C8Q75DRAFT_807516 [Abortiporus biennis]|nr:hypothetical protein C8Q75DRAFT_807516 [Abortiporus biennis]
MPVVEKGCTGVAMVQRQVVLIEASRTHTVHDRYLEVFTYIPFGHRTFLATEVPLARIPPMDVLTIFPSSDVMRKPEKGMLEIPPKAFAEFLELNAMAQKKYERLYNAWAAAGIST